MRKYILTIEKKTKVRNESLMIFGFWKRILTEFLKIVLNIDDFSQSKRGLFLGETFGNLFDWMVNECKQGSIYYSGNDEKVKV